MGLVALELLWPGRCAGCRQPCSSALFCGPCHGTLVCGAHVSCPVCGRLDGGSGEPHRCGGCLREPPPFHRARAAFAYGGLLGEVITRWKNGRDESLGRPLADLMARQADAHGWGLLDPCGVVVPVPTHWRRLFVRGFHPPGVLATTLARRIGRPVMHGALRWVRPVPSSRGRGRRARARRLRGVIQPGTRKLSGRHVLLVDDVLTTGATAQAAALACLRAGARSVEVAVLARAE